MQKLNELEDVARQLEPDIAQRKVITNKTTDYVNRYIESLSTAPGYRNGACNELPSLEITDRGKPIDKLFDLLRDEVDTLGINSASGAHLGYIPGGGLWTSAIADLLAAVANRYAGIAYSSPGGVAIENKLIEWLCSLVGYPADAHGNLSSGGSISNQIAIQTARDHYGINSKNIERSVIYLSGQTHHCIQKAIHTTGLDEAVVREIPFDDRYRMDVDALQQQMEKDRKEGLSPFIVIATAGTTDTGAVDPLDSIADVCSVYNAWFHVDAAYGGFFLLVDKLKEKFKGIERSDSVVLDPHKTLFIPYGSGVVLIKNRNALLESYSSKAAYMKDAYRTDEISPADSGPELSKHFRGLRIWLPIHYHGLAPFRANLEEKWLLCRYFHEQIEKTGFETGPDPQLSITLFRYPKDNTNSHTQKLLDALHADGRYFFSSTTLGDELWIRCAVVSFRTHLDEINGALKMIKEISGDLF